MPPNKQIVDFVILSRDPLGPSYKNEIFKSNLNQFFKQAYLLKLFKPPTHHWSPKDVCVFKNKVYWMEF